MDQLILNAAIPTGVDARRVLPSKEFVVYSAQLQRGMRVHTLFCC